MQYKNFPKIYSFSNYRQYLKEVVNFHLEQGESYRSLAILCNLASPNYIQQILGNKRNLTLKAAQKIIKGFKLNESDSKYFLNLVKLENNRYKNKDHILDELRKLTTRNNRTKIKDISIHSHWLHGVIFELALLKKFQMTVENIKSRIGHLCSDNDIESSLKFLKSKKWLVHNTEQNTYRQNQVEFEPLDDIRRIDLQRSHLRYLEFAKHRIIDDVQDREYRGLTIAIPRHKLPTIKQQIRDFFKLLRQELEEDNNTDTVVRFQFCLYKLTKD